jgi:hypothetical protein
MASFSQASPPTRCTNLYPPPYAPHDLPISFVSILPPAQYWVRSTDHSAPRYATHDYLFNLRFLGAFEKLRKLYVSFVIYVLHPSVRMKQLYSHWKDFYKIWYLRIFRKSVKPNKFSLNFWSVFLRTKKFSDKKLHRKSKHTLYVQWRFSVFVLFIK